MKISRPGFPMIDTDAPAKPRATESQGAAASTASSTSPPTGAAPSTPLVPPVPQALGTGQSIAAEAADLAARLAAEGK